MFSLADRTFFWLPLCIFVAVSGAFAQQDTDGDGLLDLLDLSGQITSTSIKSGDFEGLTNLQVLDLGFNKITSIENGSFHGLANLEVLSLVGNELWRIESGQFAGLNNLETLILFSNRIQSIEDGAFEGLSNLQDLLLHDNLLTAFPSSLNFSGASFESWEPCEFSPDNPGFSEFSGLCIPFDFRGLILDDAELSQSSFIAIVGETTLITDVSLDGLTFTDANPENLEALLGIETLNKVTVDLNLYLMYASEFDAFAAMEGNSLTVVPEPSGFVLLGMFTACLGCLRQVRNARFTLRGCSTVSSF